jgi:hypothetical protein
MGPLKLTLCAGAAVLAATLTPAAYAASADDTAGVSVTPAAPVPGSDVALRVNGCTEKTGTAISAAFVTDVRLVVGADGTLVGESRVRSTLTAGTYEVKVDCGGADRKGTINVGHASAPPSAPSSVVPASPVAPVHAGGGGAANIVAVDARSAGPGTAHAVTGLVLAAVAAVVVALRSSRRSRETD